MHSTRPSTHSLQLRGVFASSGVTLRWPGLDRCVALLHVAWQDIRLSPTGHSPPPSDYLQKSGSPNEISFVEDRYLCGVPIAFGPLFLLMFCIFLHTSFFRFCSLMNISGLLLALFGDLHKAPFSIYTIHQPLPPPKKKAPTPRPPKIPTHAI